MRKQEFNSKLISLLPLDEVPVHVPLRRPRPLRFERLRVGGEGKADANLTNFLSTCCALAPQLAATPWGGSPPRPLCQKICYSDCTENCPLRPLRAQLASPTLLGDAVGQNSARADSGIMGWGDIWGDIWGDL